MKKIKTVELIWAELHAVILAVIEELKAVKSPYVVQHQCNGAWPAKGMPMWGTALLQSETCIYVGHVDGCQNPLPHWEGDWNRQARILVCSLEVAAWVHETSGHGSTAAV